ncbi:MAG: hypothetical protein KF752_03905 [Pirellulaceae bacterium]|nr:hypothetical protein [Pirellulaceae bacterium]
MSATEMVSDLAWSYDLVGYRLSQTKKAVDGGFEGPSSNTTVVTEYQYDVNNRLTTESFISHTTTISDQPVTTTSGARTITYAYNKTLQTSKTKVAGNITTTQSFSYNRQGLMASVITQTSNESLLQRVDYSYDTGGHRVGTAEYQVPSSSPQNWTLLASTRYLTDEQNPTGYSQVLEQVVYSAAGQPTKKIIYIVGHDQISQATYTIDTSGFQSLASNLFFGTDGHGSVRALYDLAEAVATVGTSLPQQFDYDAYGNLLGWDGVQPATTYLYSGEAFDFRIGQQYLRARWYDPSNGRFIGLDPFGGNSADPQSFHKYAYVHGDPVNGADPSGEFLAVVVGGLASLGTYAFLRSRNDGAALGALALIKQSALYTPAGAAGYLGTGTFYVGWFSTEALWYASQKRPGHDENSNKALWINNVEQILRRRVTTDSSLSVGNRARAMAATRAIATEYVNAVQNNGQKEHGLLDANEARFGHGGFFGWMGNWGDPERHCTTWVNQITPRLDHAARNSGWVVRGHHNRITAGDMLLFWWTHSYISVSLEPNAGPMANSQQISKVDLVFDAWGTGRPDVYRGDEFTARWPMITWPVDPWGG